MNPQGCGVEFRVLGTVEIAAGDRVVELGSAKQRALLVSLLLRVNHVVPVEVLVDDLWGESPPPAVHATLQSLVSRLRRAFGAAAAGSDVEGPRLRSRDGGYVLESAPARVDAVRFEELVAAGRRALVDGEAATAAGSLHGALALWRGPALGDLADRPFARGEAQRLEEVRLGATEDLADALLALGRPQDALDRLEGHVARHPLRERPWGQAMLALYRLGRQADALHAFQRVRRVLADELGVEAMPELRALTERILHQDPDLIAPPDPGRHWTGDVVAFLFLDAGKEEDLARVRAVLLSEVESRSGEVVGHTGTAFRTAFPTVAAALGAAIAVQRGRRGGRGTTDRRGVRMAVHAGAADRRGGSWIGRSLDRTARLLAAAAPGQMVCSHVAAELGQDDLPQGTSLIDLGEHRFGDLARPERVYQIAHSDLPADFPALRTYAVSRHNLPAALTSFVGRKRELDEVVSLIATSRLLTLTGPGGSGKTRLALQAAGAVLGSHPDGVWFVELAQIRDPGLVTDEVVTSLGLLPGPLARSGNPLDRGLCDHLHDSRLMLLLDNCEHVVESAAWLAQAILTRCPDVTVLATSREVLGVPGEVVWKTPGLSLPAEQASSVEELTGSDAVALFCDRAQVARPGFGLSAANSAAVARICRRLDGIPLGLELAAGKIRVLGAHQVAARLDDRFRLLTDGSRTAVPRHQTLRAAMDWSYGLLPGPEQAVLRRISVFRGPFTLDAAEAVAGDVPPESTSGPAFEVLALLTRLVDKSMLSVVVAVGDEPEVRYRLLETIREYAGQELANAGEWDDARTRHRDYFLGMADDWATASDYWNWWSWLRSLEADHDNFTAALEWSQTTGDDDALLRLATAHWPYWYWGEKLDWRRWLVDAIGRCVTPGPARVEALIALASLLMRSGAEPARYQPLFAEARKVALSLPDGQSVAQVDFYRAHVLLSSGDPRAAEGLLRGAIGRSTNTDFLGWCHWALGWIALTDGHDRSAVEFDTALELADGADDESLRAHVGSAIALVAALGDDPDTAAAMAARAVRSAERIVGAPRVLMMALAHTSQAAVLSRDDRAAAPVSRLLRILRDIGVTHWADEALDVAGLVLADRSPREAAVALSASRPIGDGDGRLGPMRERLVHCGSRLAETLGPQVWDNAVQRAGAMSVEQAISRALAALTLQR